MGRRGSKIIPFLMDGLASSRYANLRYVNEAKSEFSLLLPRKTQKLNAKYECILKDWRKLRNQVYKYTKAKQAIESALKKSVFLEQLPAHGETWNYRILSNNEIKEKKRLVKELAAAKKEFNNPGSVNSSGYGSGGDSPATSVSLGEEEVMTDPIKQEHAYSLLTEESYGETDSSFPVQETITIGASEADSAMEDDSDSLNESAFVDPNNIIIDYRNTPSFNFQNQTSDCEAMDIRTEEIVHQIEKENPPAFDDMLSNTYSHYLATYFTVVDLQTAFEDFPTEEPSDTLELNELVESLFPPVGTSSLSCSVNPELSLIAPSNGSSSEMLTDSSLSSPSIDSNLEKIPMQSTIVYCFKESKTVSDGEIWIFEPQVLEVTVNGNNEKYPGSPKMIIDDKRQIKTLQSSKGIESIEVNPVTLQISVFLKHTENL